MPSISSAETKLPISPLPKLPAGGPLPAREWPWNLSPGQVRAQLFDGHIGSRERRQQVEADGQLFIDVDTARERADVAHCTEKLNQAADVILERASVGQQKRAEFLVNLVVSAASESSGPFAAPAQDVLGRLFVQADEITRTDILNSAHKMFRENGNQGQPFSAMVTYMGGRAPVPPAGHNGPGHQQDFINSLKSQVDKLDDDALCSGRMVWYDELVSACGTLQNLQLHSLPVTLPADGQRAGCLAQFAAAREILEADPSRPVALLVNTDNSPGALKHWIQVVGALDAQGKLNWLVFNTADGVDRATKGIWDLADLLEDVDPGSVKVHSYSMQEHTPNACGSLGYDMFKRLNAAVARGEVSAEQLGGQMEHFGSQFCRASPQKQQAIDLIARAEIMQKAANDAPSVRAFGALHEARPAMPSSLPPELLVRIPPPLPVGQPPAIKEAMNADDAPPPLPAALPPLESPASTEAVIARYQQITEAAFEKIKKDPRAMVEAQPQTLQPQKLTPKQIADVNKRADQFMSSDKTDRLEAIVRSQASPAAGNAAKADESKPRV